MDEHMELETDLAEVDVAVAGDDAEPTAVESTTIAAATAPAAVEDAGAVAGVAAADGAAAADTFNVSSHCYRLLMRADRQGERAGPLIAETKYTLQMLSLDISCTMLGCFCAFQLSPRST